MPRAVSQARPRLRRLGGQLVQLYASSPALAARGPGGAQSQGRWAQPLLGAVVQISFDAPAGVTGGYDPRGGGGELGIVEGDGESPGDEFDTVESLGSERAADERFPAGAPRAGRRGSG